MKKVEISKTLVKEYTEKELVHFIAGSLKQLAKYPEAERSAEVCYGELMNNVAYLAAIATALDQKMNGKDTTIVV